MQKLIDKTTIKFLIVGVINTIVGNGAMFLIYNFVYQNYWVSSIANYVIGGIVSYFLNKHFTFNYKKKSIMTLVLFIINTALCWLIAYGIAKPLATYLLTSTTVNVRDNVAMLVGMCLYVGLNYFGQRFIVFADKDADKKDESK